MVDRSIEGRHLFGLLVSVVAAMANSRSWRDSVTTSIATLSRGIPRIVNRPSAVSGSPERKRRPHQVQPVVVPRPLSTGPSSGSMPRTLIFAAKTGMPPGSITRPRMIPSGPSLSVIGVRSRRGVSCIHARPCPSARATMSQGRRFGPASGISETPAREPRRTGIGPLRRWWSPSRCHEFLLRLAKEFLAGLTRHSPAPGKPTTHAG